MRESYLQRGTSMKAVKMLGNKQVSVVDMPDPQADSNEYRLEQSLRCGADQALSPTLREMTC